tara:strand:- start:196 stop:819 length:624 start_codon:yes stop_codon:yes gene_type:complete
VYRRLIGSVSQYGEDVILDRLLGKKKVGFFLDIGANHPRKFSNTFRFSKRGWVGVNVEPDPELYKRFPKERPNDINLNVGVGPINGKMPFYKISADTLSTFNKEAADKAIQDGHKLINTITVPVISLEMLLEKYKPNGNIDFMSLDVEGFEMEVLKSNDWSRFRPYLIIVEVDKGGESIKSYLKGVGYRENFNNGTNCIFIDDGYNL